MPTANVENVSRYQARTMGERIQLSIVTVQETQGITRGMLRERIELITPGNPSTGEWQYPQSLHAIFMSL